MNQLTDSFNLIRRSYPYWSTYICFAEAIRRTPDVKDSEINKCFDKLVDKDDYSRSDKDNLLKQLKKL